MSDQRLPAERPETRDKPDKAARDSEGSPAMVGAGIFASCDTHPKGGDAKQAPFMGSAVPKADARNTGISGTKGRTA